MTGTSGNLERRILQLAAQTQVDDVKKKIESASLNASMLNR